MSASTPLEAVSHIETMVLTAGLDVPIKAIRDQMASALDLIVHQSRFPDGSRRITQIVEVLEIEGDIVTLQNIFIYDHQAAGALRPTGVEPRFLKKLTVNGVRIDPRVFAADNSP